VRDVAVIGAGPAGLTAARALASRGHDVVVLEEHFQIGVPVHCTGVLGLDAFQEFELPRESILGSADTATFVAADGSSVLVDAENARAVIVDRAVFDQRLADESRAAGAELRAGTRVLAIAAGAKSVKVSVEGGAPIEARSCVLACGANYRFNRQLGLGVPRSFLQSAQLEEPLDGPSTVEVHLGREVAPAGFGWVVPFRRGGVPHARLGLMCDSRALARFRAFASRVRTRYGQTDDGQRQPREPRLKILPLGPVSRTYTTRLLAVGDAAGLAKPTTGGGIYYSLISGQLAAGTLDEALRADDLRESRMRRYETQWRDRVGAEIRIGLAFRVLASRMNDRAIDAVIELARVDGIVPLLRQTADFNWHRQSALALLKHAQFRKILLSSLWS
jgi:digeranylgeranylglycerophospholipid reductase